MTSATSLRRNLQWVLAGNLVYAGCQWAMLVVLARLGTPEMVGDFALGLALTAPLFVLATLNLRAAQATDQRRDYAFADYAQLRLLCVVAAVVVLAVILAGGDFGRTTVAIVALLGATKSIDALGDVVYGLLQQHECMRRIGVSRILHGLLQLAALAAAMLLTRSLIAAAAAMALVSLVVTVLYDVRSARLIARTGELFLWRRPCWPTLGRLLVLTLPLGVAAALDSLNTSVPRYVLDAHGGREAIGYYAAIAYFLVGQGTLVVALADAARPRLARALLTSREEFVTLARRLGLIALAIGGFGLVLASVAGAQILRLLYGPEYASQTSVFVAIMAAAIPWNLAGVIGTALAAARRFRALLLSFVVMTGVTTFASLALVPEHGALGAAWALGLGMVARLAAASLSLWWVLHGGGLRSAALQASTARAQVQAS